MRIQRSILVSLLGLYQVLALQDASCNYKTYPIFAGGNKNEYVNTQLVDETTQLTYVGGKTQSANFAPAENDHGFVFAVDTVGHWRWGQFFYNVSYCVSEVTGMQMSSHGSALTVLGYSNSKPIIMNLDKSAGSILKFITIEPVVTPTTTPTYITY